MNAVLKRELRAFFHTPIAYVFISAAYLFSGLYFYAYNLYGGATNFSSLFGVLFSIVLFLIPILTMRLLSEESRQKTDQLLLTSPASGTGIVLGKYFSALFVYMTGIASTLLNACILSFFAPVNWKLVFGNYFGLVFLGGALIAICLLVSSLTENQMIAAVGGFCVSIFVILIDALSPMVNNEMIRKVMGYLNFSTRYAPFTMGIFALENIIYFLSIAALFLYLTIMRLEGRRRS